MAEELPRAAGIERKVKNLSALDAFVGAEATKPVAAFAPVTLQETPYMQAMRAGMAHLPWLRDVGKSLRAVARILPSGLTPALTPHAPEPERAALVARWRARAAGLSGPTALSEAESKELLAAFGIRGPAEVVVATPEEAVAAAAKIGYPVVLKGVSAAVPHKSDAGLVLLGLADAQAVREGAQLIASRCAALGAPLEGILVAEQVSGAIEMVLGLHRDPEMGHAVMVGMGGVWLELFKDVAFAPPGLGLERARQTIAQTRAAQLLAGYRGAPASDGEALAQAMVNLGRLACELGDVIEAVDVNPVAVRAQGRGVVALDALVVLRPLQV
jgi:acyl-CoA synthetase (NDP forming)